MSYFDDNEDYIIYWRRSSAPRPNHTCRYCSTPIFFVTRGGAPLDASNGDVHRCAEREERIRAEALAGFEVLE